MSGLRLDHALAYLPPEMPGFGPAGRAIYEDTIARAWGYYRELTALLQGDAREILSDIWHIGPMSHAKRVEKVDIAKSGSGYLAKRADGPALFVLDAKAVEDIQKAAGGLKPAEAPPAKK